MPKIIFQPLMIANPQGAWRALIPMFKVKMMNILLRLPCPRSCPSW